MDAATMLLRFDDANISVLSFSHKSSKGGTDLSTAAAYSETKFS